MYELASATLADSGYEQYEISNWSLGGQHACRHNLAYWRSTGYIGLGAGAHSYFGDYRYSNELSPRKYIDKALGGHDTKVEREFIDAELARAEMVILGLRLNDGFTLTLQESRPAGRLS